MRTSSIGLLRQGRSIFSNTHIFIYKYTIVIVMPSRTIYVSRKNWIRLKRLKNKSMLINRLLEREFYQGEK